VIRRLVRDLDLPVRIEALPTLREPDGLALSSRNVRLAAADRDRALALKQGLDAATAAAATTSDPAAVQAAAVAAMRERGVDPEYLALVNPDTFVPVDAVDGDVLVAVAARVGDVRLIDNTLISSNGGRRP
jgi:pantoate--beta-alanine ligase